MAECCGEVSEAYCLSLRLQKLGRDVVKTKTNLGVLQDNETIFASGLSFYFYFSLTQYMRSTSTAERILQRDCEK